MLAVVAANFVRGFGAARGHASSQRAPGYLESSPANAIAWFAVCQIVLWTLLPLLLSRSMPLDIVSDMLPWGHEWQWGYYKHPPLPAWFSEAAFVVAGDFGIYLLSQIFIVATLLFVYRLGCQMLAPKYAAAGTLLLAGVYYFSIPTPEFNNNVAQMPFWAGATYALYRALNDGRMRYWIALGLALGLGLLCKYSTAMLVAAMLLSTAAISHHRAVWKTTGPYIAGLVATLAFLPNFIWLVENRFIAVGYAQARAGAFGGFFGGLLGGMKFAATQAIDHGPALAIAGASGAIRRNFGDDLTEKQRRDFHFLLFVGLGPALLSMTISLASGLGMRSMWGAPMWNLSGLIIMLGAASYQQKISLTLLSKLVGLVFIGGLCVYALSAKIIPDFRGHRSRLSWPAAQIAQTFARAYQAKTGDSLRIVGGDDWLAGMIAMRLPTRPSVFSQDSFVTAPWITPDRLAREGMLVVWPDGGKRRSPALDIPGLELAGSIRFAWPWPGRARPLIIDWGIVPRRAAFKQSPHAATAGALFH